MNNPISTYRIQFHKEFSFNDFENIISYLKKLGVATVYASPVFASVPGSTHGYDGIHPHRINPEIGNEEQLKAIIERLRADEISWLQDIVPNHMAFHPDNKWLMDVLEKDRQSVYASFFDIDWDSQIYNGKLMVPFLGAPVDELITSDLRIEYSGDRFVCRYFDALYPLNRKSYAVILNSESTGLQDVKQLILQLENLHRVEDPKMYARQWDEFLLQLSSLMKNDEVRAFADKCLNTINSDKNILGQILDEQFYQLTFWKETDKQINFRRFFLVNGLICLKIQDEKVFEEYHSYIRSLLKQGLIQGLRIDHIDGLHNPQSYLTQIRKLVGDDTYIIVEKILEPGEELMKDWPIQGNTGYDFLAMVNNLFTDKSAEKDFTKFYKKLVSDKRPIHRQIHEKKTAILNQHMAGELENLYRLFLDLNLINEKDLETAGDLKTAIGELLIQCPVYRYYGNYFPLEVKEATALKNILKQIKERNKALKNPVEILEKVLLIQPGKADEKYNAKALKFYQRCMQFTGPLMAKGVEDTLMYTYNRFIGHNEVGDSPENFGYSPEEFHQLMTERQANWPLSINGTSTHDTKRGEDVRARLNVLTEISDDWLETIQQWQFLNADISKEYRLAANDEYLIYQTLVGALPMPGQDDTDFEPRVHQYLEKALREAKQHSNWSNPDGNYENAAKNFASALLDKNKPFYQLLQKFNHKIADFGIINSLSQLLLKFTCPGVPDVYQGCELWDLSLVDPDNRRPVDYEKRRSLLEDIESADFQDLWKKRYEGQIKLWLTYQLFYIRKNHSGLFASADYIPLKVKGKYKEHVFAFARRFQSEWLIVAVPLHLAKLSKLQKYKPEELKWKNTRIVLPADIPEEIENLLTGIKEKAGIEVLIKNVFNQLPLALLKMQQPPTDRGAGILLHITSLPSPFGIGDLGPGAKAFADYLSSGRQKYWQLLPLSPTGEAQLYSPYSAISSMAGNTLLISPELLADEGLLTRAELKKFYLKENNKVDYAAAQEIKAKLFNEAYHNFCEGASGELQNKFKGFCVAEADWLNDFALYTVIKQKHQGKPWYEWPEEFKLHNTKSLEEFADRNLEALNEIKWLQFIFFKQCKELKNYCNQLNIQLFGDLPFYVSHDSSDVWANKEIFCLNEEGMISGIAGVPPDYFNDNGQLWGMPVFKWDVLKERNYDWWIKRIKKNMQLYDLLRLDHFRAFSSYWDVPAGEETAKNGEWKPGPGADFFKVIKEEFGKLPFVAEDLGDIDQAVYDLRDEFDLPGMRVLQFAFGDDFAASVHIPHNYTINSIVYTGTHDNNTTAGWYRQEVDSISKKNLKIYSDKKAGKDNSHLVLAKLAYSSVAKLVILPIQDVIGLDESSRMNTPASLDKNWVWRLKPGQLKKKYARKLKNWVKMYNR